MTLHAIKDRDVKADEISNNSLFYCSREELNNILTNCDFGDAVNYRMTVVIPPEREKMKGGIYLPNNASETEQSKTSIGRVISRGSTVGDNPSLRDCKDIEVGDYVKFQFYAAGLPEKINGVMVKYLVDDQVMVRIKNPDIVARLYDY